MKDQYFFIPWLISVICFFAAVWIQGAAETELRKLEKEAIEHGYAIHNPQTGDWQWKEATKCSR